MPQAEASPFFSVVVPLFNKRRFIERAVQSIAAQTEGDFEAIIVDDGSTDEGAGAARHAFGHDPRFRIVTQANQGVSRARNAGAELAGGRWIAFLDADDEWAPSFLSAVRQVAEVTPGLTMVSTAYDQIEDHVIYNDWGFGDQGAVAVDYDFFALWAASDAPPVWSSAVAVERRAFLASGGFPEGVSLGEDIIAWMRMLPTGRRAFIARKLSTSHSDDRGSLTRSPSLRSVLSHERLVEALEPLVHPDAGRIRRMVGTSHCYMLMKAKARGELLGYLLRHGLQVPARTWVASFLYLIGLSRLLSSLTPTAAASSVKGSA